MTRQFVRGQRLVVELSLLAVFLSVLFFVIDLLTVQTRETIFGYKRLDGHPEVRTSYFEVAESKNEILKPKGATDTLVFTAKAGLRQLDSFTITALSHCACP
jgi:hypothetical protein